MKALALMAVFSLFLAGCDSSGPEPQASASGKELFDHHCSGCHRQEGTGNFLKGIPANVMTKLDVDGVAHLIRYGDPEMPKMPVFSNLSRYQAERIASHLFDLRKQWVEKRQSGS